MKRAAIYARYSTDLQNDKSVEDQIRLCEAHAQRIGARIVKNFHDRAKSGASMFGRAGLSQLMQEAEKGTFEILISESPDRVSRDIADLAHIHKTLKFRGIEMNCVNGGVMDTMQIGMYGVVGQMQREEGAKKVKRGMMGVVRSGRNAGGKAYGYEPVPGKPGELAIIEEQAAIIRRIFKQFAAGVSARSIAGALNDENVPPPRGSKWNASTINGNGARGYGILRNPIYDGRIIWNRVRMVKDPSTGRRVSRVNDASEHETIEAPHLRIVEEKLFAAVQKRKEDATEFAMPLVRSRRILSGLLRCRSCGGGMSIVGSDRSGPRVMCSTHRESRTCDNDARYYIEKIEQKVLNTLRQQFADSDMIKAYVNTYEEERRRTSADLKRNRASIERQLDEAKRAIARVVEKVAKGIIEDDDAAAILPGLREERDRHSADLSKMEKPNNVIELFPLAVRRFKENLEKLTEILSAAGEIPDADAVLTFRELVASVIVDPRKAGEDYVVEIKGYLSSLIQPEMSAVVVVAGEGLEPPTRGL
ncbi:recombinase family protein [Rhizobium pusense]|uniref:Recombinase family protein n=1 Tax=Agrobacterium pusense TaxID=648995 RepID=A0A6H0ZWP1_9HYPH|nr:recombinase family protein [Agrobacterium pusense]MDH2092075.1 recombinase family protein [Agrobacterium pusense]QIX25059.1 recombinase family protein [Agrobacterium pusense]